MANNAANEVAVKCGYMLIKRPHSDAKQFRIKAWQTKYFVLKGDYLNNNCRLEYFKNESACSSPKAEKNCISLDNVDIFIDEYVSRSQDHSFILCVKGQYPLVLACESEQLKTEWITTLKGVALKCTEQRDTSQKGAALKSVGPLSAALFPNGNMSPTAVPKAFSRTPEHMMTQGSSLVENNSTSAVAEYQVTTRLTPSSEHNDIRGEYIMRLTSDTIVLMSLDKSHEAISWPIVYVRKFKSEATESTDLTRRQLLTLEISSKSPRGQGIFQFHTESGNKIASLIRAAAHHFVDTHHRREALTRMNTWSEKKIESIQSDEFNLTAKRRNTVIGGKKSNTKAGTNPELETVAHQEVDHCGMQVVYEWSSPEGSQDELDMFPSPTNGETNSSTKLEDRSLVLENVNKSGEMDENKVLGNTDRVVEAVEGEVESNSYIDILADEHATPIHISDRKHPDGLTHDITSASGENSCLSAMNTSAPPGNASAAEIPSERGNIVTGVCELLTTNDSKECSSTNSSKEISVSAVENAGGGEISKLPIAATDAATRRLYNDLVAQISNPTEHPQSVFPSRSSRSHAYENVQRDKFKARKQLSEEQEAQEEEKRKDLIEKLTENPRSLLEDVLNQLATPQKHNARDVFPYMGHRNSIGELSTERFQEEAVFSQPEKGRESESPKKALGKSKSDMGTASFQTNPPPVPIRPEVSRGLGRRSDGDILDSIARNIQFSTPRNPTQVGKGIRKSSGIGSRFPLALVANRFDMNTMAFQSEVSTEHSRSKSQEDPLRSLRTFEAGESVFTTETARHKAERSKSEAETMKTCSNSTVLQSKTAFERAGEDNEKKRIMPRPSKFAKKLWKNVSSPPSSPLSTSLRKFTKRRESSSSCGEEERAEVDKIPEQPRRQSLTPVSSTAIARLSGSFSEHSTPETSPKLERKRENSKEDTHVFISKSSFDESHHVAVSCIVDSMDTEPAPVIPPRKKEEPPPLPPRKAKPSSQGSSCSSCSHGSCSHGNSHQKDAFHGDDQFHGNSKQKNKKQHGADKSKVFVPSTRRRSSGEKNSLGSYDDNLPPPPPVPPRRDGSRSPSPAPHLPYKPSTPLIQLTWSSISEAEQQESDTKYKDERFEARPHSTSDASHKSDEDRSRSSSEVSQPQESERSRSGSEENHQSDTESEQSCPTSPSYPSSQDAAPPRPPTSARGLKASEFFHTRQEEFVCSDNSDVELELADSQRHRANDSNTGLTAEAPKSPKYSNMACSSEDLTADLTDSSLPASSAAEMYASTIAGKQESQNQLIPRCSGDSGRASPGGTSPIALKMASQVLTLNGAGESNTPLRV